MFHKLKVFLSSTQYNDEFKVERDVLPFLFRKEPLSSIFDLWKIENQAAAVPIEDEYLRNIQNSDLVILLIDSIIRDAVRKEITEAQIKNKPIYSFIRENANRSSEAILFINEIRNISTSTNYANVDELFGKIEDSLLAFYIPKMNKKEEKNDVKNSECFDIQERSLKIALFALNRQSSSISVEKILPLLISEILIDKEATTEEIVTYLPIKNMETIDLTLKEMESNLELTRNGNKYTLAAHRKSEIASIASAVDAEEESVQDLLSHKYASVVSMDKDQFLHLLKKCIALVIYRTTTKVNDFFSNIGKSAYDAETLKTIVLNSVISCLGEIDNYALWQNIILEILNTKDSKIIKWVNSIHKSFWFLATLGCDGKTNGIFLDNIADYQIFFDSHIVLRGILGSGSESEICSEIINFGKDLKVKMFLSEFMFNEVKKAFEQANNIVESCNGDIKRVFSLLSNLGRNHDIIDAFGKKLIENPDLSWEEYISQFFSYSSENILITYLENIHNITIYDSDFSIDEWKDVDNIIKELMSKRAKKIERAISLSKDPENEQERQYNLRSNEAKQLELIYQLRSKGNTNYWFVTFDQFIYDTCVSVYKASKNDGKYFPCFMKPNKWLEILKLSLKESIDETIFNDILMSPAMHHAVNSVEATVITEILKRNIDTKISDKKVLSNMFSEAVNKAVVTDIKNEINAGRNDSATINDIDDVIKSVLYDRMRKYDEIFKKQNLEIEKTKKEKDKEHRRTNYYKALLTTVLKSKKKK